MTVRREGIGSLEREVLEEQLRLLAERRPDAGVVDAFELKHLVSVILHGAVVLQDLYTADRVGSVYAGDPRAIARSLVLPLAESEAPDLDLLARAGRLPEEVRRLGDKCLFDVGISGVSRYRGFDLHDLGIRAYRMASEILDLLADDRTLREFFERNRLAPLPIREEVSFLRQCSDRFALHADLLRGLPLGEPALPDSVTMLLVPAPRNDSATGAPALSNPDAPTASSVEVASEFDSLPLDREDLLSTYERILLFASLDVEQLRRDLGGIVVDQPGAVDALCDEFALYAAGTQNLTRPPSYFFVGPTGVGKNYLVETLVRLLTHAWGVEIPFLTIDGPNFTDASDINELRGSTRGFIRSDEEGVLSEFHARSSQAPLSFLLVDEIEKAHPHLRKFFLGLMDRGTVTDNRGRTLHFSNSMLVFTSNIGYSEALQRGTPIGYRGDDSREAFEESEVSSGLRQSLSAEFVNRVRIIRFEHLSRGSIEKIFDLEFRNVRKRFDEVHGIDLQVSQAARDAILARGYSHDYGARHLGAVLNRVANVEVSKRLKKDDRRPEKSHGEVLDYVRQIRRKERVFDPREIRARVLDAARVRVPYRTLTIDFLNEEFVYRT